MTPNSDRGGRRPWAMAALWGMLPVLLLTPLLLWLGRSFAKQLAYEQRNRTQQLLDLHAGAVQRSLNMIEGKLDELSAFVGRQTAGGRSVDEAEFNTFASGLYASSQWIRAFQIVTNGVITHAYPRHGNEATLGYDLLTAPPSVSGGDVARALRTGQITVTGPLNLIQGGLGIVIRQPVPQPNGPPIRLVGVVLNLAPLLAESGIKGDNIGDVRLAIRRESGEVFYGSPAVFADAPVTSRLALPEGAWEIGGSPRRGWLGSPNPALGWFYFVGGAIIALLGLLVFVLAHGRANLAAMVQERTDALRGELVARRQAQEQLQQNYALLQAVTEGMSDAVFAKDPQGRYQMINSAGARFLGRRPDTIIGRTDQELFPADLAAAFGEADRRVIESGRVQTVEGPATLGGSTSYYQATKTPWRDQNGAIIGVVGVSRDVTERMEMEEALRASERQLSLILNNVSDVIFAIAVEPGGEFRFTSVNRRFLEATGVAENQVVGALVRDIIPPPAQALVLERYREAIRTGAPVRWDEVSQYPAGQKVGHVTVVPVFNDGGACTQLVGMVHDVTERMVAEETVRRLNEDLRHHAEALEQRVAERTAELAEAKDRAEAADRVKSSFLATMSHELRTPLNSIIGFTGVLLQGLAGPLNREQNKQLEMVRDSARHLLALINDVLDISKIEAAQLVVTRERVAVRAAVERVIGMVRPLADRKGLTLDSTIAPEVASVSADQRRLEQVLLNLLNNAVKFTERGEVALRVWREARADGPAPAVVRFEVRDTGIGIKPADLPNLFQPFRQIDTGLTRHHEGTGLGLAICRRLADLMGGEIGVASEWGRGSVFTFTLPANAPDEP